MICKHCGREINNTVKLCPYCGGSLSTSDTDSAKEALKKTAGAVMDSAKAIGNRVNEATDGQAQKYAEKAKETAKGFTDDVKQVAKDKDASNFFTKNKYRNVKIIAVLLIAVFILGSSFSGGSDDNEELAILAVEKRIYQADPTIEFSNADVIGKDGKGRYLVSLTLNDDAYAVGVAVFPPNSDDVFTSVCPYDDKKDKKSVIKKMKDLSNWGTPVE